MSLVPTDGDDGKEVSTVPAENAAAADGKMSLEHLIQFGLPALQQRLGEQEGHLTKARRRHERAAKMNNDAFEAWDDCCATVLGAESDALPLFPELAEGMDVDAAIDAYAIDVGRAAAGPLRREWRQASGRFLQHLAVGADGSDGGGTKCYGREIAEAVEYYRQFREFVGAASGALDDDAAGAADELATLHSYVSNGEQEPSASESESLLEQFTTSPAARAALAGDLHRLAAFLSARTCELSSRSTQMRSGREVANEVELQWTQHCLRVGSALNGISPGEVVRYRDAVRAMVAQMAGDSVNARRLRFLADAVGRPANEDALACPQFRSACREAARRAFRMTLCQDGQERSAKTVEQCAAAMDATREEMSRLERRIDCLREGVGEG